MELDSIVIGWLIGLITYHFFAKRILNKPKDETLNKIKDLLKKK